MRSPFIKLQLQTEERPSNSSVRRRMPRPLFSSSKWGARMHKQFYRNLLRRKKTLLKRMRFHKFLKLKGKPKLAINPAMFNDKFLLAVAGKQELFLRSKDKGSFLHALIECATAPIVPHPETLKAAAAAVGTTAGFVLNNTSL